MGSPECPSWKERRQKLRTYKCRKCGVKFKAYYRAEEDRVCTRCLSKS